MQDYENMSKEQLIAEVKRLEIKLEHSQIKVDEFENFNESLLKANTNLNNLIQAVQLLVNEAYENIRSN